MSSAMKARRNRTTYVPVPSSVEKCTLCLISTPGCPHWTIAIMRCAGSAASWNTVPNQWPSPRLLTQGSTPVTM